VAPASSTITIIFCSYSFSDGLWSPKHFYDFMLSSISVRYESMYRIEYIKISTNKGTDSHSKNTNCTYRTTYDSWLVVFVRTNGTATRTVLRVVCSTSTTVPLVQVLVQVSELIVQVVINQYRTVSIEITVITSTPSVLE
jgi:hypothetical protein